MTVYVGIDLHSNNNVVAIEDQDGKCVKRKRLANKMETVLAFLEPYRSEVAGVVVESTYNWYWLVDGLQDHGYRVHLANPAGNHQYEGMKYGDDESDALWLASLLRLGLLKEGYIHPREDRAIRDLVRKRSQLVRNHTRQMLSVQNLVSRNTGEGITARAVRELTTEGVEALGLQSEVVLAMNTNVAVMLCLREQIDLLEKAILSRVRLRKSYKRLLSVDGIGKVLAITIMLETGDITRFKTVGNYVSYCRCVKSLRISNKKVKGRGNAKNGNKYLSWAYIEAATYAIRWNEQIRRFFQRKCAKTKRVVAIKAVAHKLARACYHIMSDGEPFDVRRAFG